MMPANGKIVQELQTAFGVESVTAQDTRDGIITLSTPVERLREILRYLQRQAQSPFNVLYDLTAIDERERRNTFRPRKADFTIVYHLRSIKRNTDLRVKAPLPNAETQAPTVTDLWPSANWYEREVWDMFGIAFGGHPDLRRLLMPPWWQGHPLRKEHPARATEMLPFEMKADEQARLEAMLDIQPEEWGLNSRGEDVGHVLLNIGPHHPGTHGLLRIIAQLDGQEIVDAACDIGFHHRGAEKMGERQSWHTYIPYTDRVDYLAGVLNNHPYVLAVEALAGIEVPDRAKVIRIMLSELFRIISHLVYYGTFVQDVGAMSPVFYMFTDRERALDIIEAITGARMHPGWFRIGGVAQDLPDGWERMVRDFLDYLPKRLREYDRMVLRNRIFRARTQGIGRLAVREALQWGATGPMLRSCGLAWDLRKTRPYGGYERFEFDVPTDDAGDCYARAVVHVEEMRQSLRIIEQCVRNMPPGAYKSDHPLATPPRKERTMHDIETLIDHFLGTAWGPVIPAGEACACVESAKGNYSYYLVSDGGTISYRTRIRTPSFAHIQMVQWMARGLMIPDLVALLGSLDYVLADVDR